MGLSSLLVNHAQLTAELILLLTYTHKMLVGLAVLSYAYLAVFVGEHLCLNTIFFVKVVCDKLVNIKRDNLHTDGINNPLVDLSYKPSCFCYLPYCSVVLSC